MARLQEPKVIRFPAGVYQALQDAAYPYRLSAADMVREACANLLRDEGREVPSALEEVRPNLPDLRRPAEMPA